MANEITSRPSQTPYTSYYKDITKINNREKSINGKILDYAVAEQEIVDYLTEKKVLRMTNDGTMELNRKLTKDDLRKEKAQIEKMITECIFSKGFSVRGYQTPDKLKVFVGEMVAEYAGYSVLENAFNDPDVDDIFCLSWDKIYVERAGRNVKYEYTFRNKQHYADVIDRMIRKAGKEINIGDSKIVDFELYGDRGCATSPAVSPKDYSLTLRKHREDHIQLDDLLYQGVLNQEIADFFGLVIDGESNIIYAGITGTGKTTTIRSLIDYYVTRNGKRMLVCEDTQELFPKNDHTLELVSCRADDAKSDVSLYKLIVTALRLKPKYIVVGEVRAEEAQAAVEGMETGHSTIFTMHAGKPINAINRLVTKYLMMMPSLGVDVVERIIGSAVDFIAVQDHIPDVGRKVSIITQVKFDDEEKRIKLEDLLKYDFDKDDWVWLKRIDDDKCRNLMRRGVKKERVALWRDTGDPEVEKKALKEMNEKYWNEKAIRQEEYNKAHEAKLEAKRKEKESLSSTQDRNDANLLYEREVQRERELADMQQKMNLLRDKVNREENS